MEVSVIAQKIFITCTGAERISFLLQSMIYGNLNAALYDNASEGPWSSARL